MLNETGYAHSTHTLLLQQKGREIHKLEIHVFRHCVVLRELDLGADDCIRRVPFMLHRNASVGLSPFHRLRSLSDTNC